MASLEQKLETLVEVTNQNSSMFKDCLYALEARQWMIMRAIERLAGSTIVDWRELEKKYMAFVEEQNQAKVAVAPAEPELPEGAVEFGGG